MPYHTKYQGNDGLIQCTLRLMVLFIKAVFDTFFHVMYMFSHEAKVNKQRAYKAYMESVQRDQKLIDHK